MWDQLTTLATLSNESQYRQTSPSNLNWSVYAVNVFPDPPGTSFLIFWFWVLLKGSVSYHPGMFQLNFQNDGYYHYCLLIWDELTALPNKAQYRQTSTSNLNIVLSLLAINVFPDAPGMTPSKLWSTAFKC